MLHKCYIIAYNNCNNLELNEVITIIRNKKKLIMCCMYMSFCVFLTGMYYISDKNNDDVAYAMVDDEAVIYNNVNTLGSAGRVVEAYSEKKVVSSAVDEYDALAYIEQCSEKNAAAVMNIHETELYVNGLKTVYRDSVKLSSEDKNIMYRIVEAEAGGEDISGRMLVANVIINRMKSGHYPESVKEVVFAHSGNVYQFSPVSDGRYYTVDVSKTTREAVDKALEGEDNSSGAEYFICRSLADKGNASWFDRSLNYLFKYGCHEFFSR